VLLLAATHSLWLSNLLSPVTLAFLLGLLAVAVRSDLRFPEAATSMLSVYLLLAIGLKGGVALAETSLAVVWVPALVTIALGLVTPLTSYGALRWLGRLSRVDAAAIAAHYGSVSAVTFLAALAYVEALGTPAQGFFPGLVALLEVPAIVLALAIARRGDGRVSLGRTLAHVLTGKSVLLLLGGMAIGLVCDASSLAKVKPFFVDPFQGVLLLFLLDLGIVAGQHLRHVRTAGWFLAVFAVVAPVAHGALGVGAGLLAGLGPTGATVLGAMTASASYIAAPAAVRMALPEANPGLYLTASLGITFPFNLTFGIPLYADLAQLWS